MCMRALIKLSQQYSPASANILSRKFPSLPPSLLPSCPPALLPLPPIMPVNLGFSPTASFSCSWSCVLMYSIGQTQVASRPARKGKPGGTEGGTEGGRGVSAVAHVPRHSLHRTPCCANLAIRIVNPSFHTTLGASAPIATSCPPSLPSVPPSPSPTPSKTYRQQWTQP